MKTINEYDFSYQANEAIEDAINQLNNTKRYLNESMNNTIKNLADLDLSIELDKFKIEFMLDYETVIEQKQTFDFAFDWFIDSNEGHDHELESCKTLKANLLKQIEKLDNQIKKVEQNEKN